MRKNRPLVYHNRDSLRDGLCRLGFRCKRIEDPDHMFEHCSGYPIHVENLVFIEPNFDVDVLPKQPHQFNATAILTIKNTDHQIKLFGGNCARIECITLKDTLIELGKMSFTVPVNISETLNKNRIVYDEAAFTKALEKFSERVNANGVPVFGECGHKIGDLIIMDSPANGMCTGKVHVGDAKLVARLFGDKSE